MAPSVEEEPSEYDRWNRGPRPEAPLAAAWLGGLLVAALTTVELHLLLTPSWWGTWPAALGAGALTAVLAVGALRAGQTATPEDQEFGSLAAELLLAILAGVGGAVLAWSSWGLPWWGAVAAGVATTVVAFLFALVVGYASSRTGVAHCASAVAFGATLIGGAALLRGPGASMWVVGLAVSVTWAVLANLLARILSVGAPPAPARPSGAEPDAAG